MSDAWWKKNSQGERNRRHEAGGQHSLAQVAKAGCLRREAWKKRCIAKVWVLQAERTHLRKSQGKMELGEFERRKQKGEREEGKCQRR